MSWGKKQGCEFVATRCASRKDFSEGDADNIVVGRGEGCNRHWKSGTGTAWTSNGVQIGDDLAGWNNGLRTFSGSCTSSRANTIIERYCQATGCRRQWPGMTESTDNDGLPAWACSI